MFVYKKKNKCGSIGIQIVHKVNRLNKVLKTIGSSSDPAEIEKAFRISKTDLRIRPVYHRLRDRIEAHICISFMACLICKELERCLQITESKITMDKAIEQINKMYEVVVDAKSKF